LTGALALVAAMAANPACALPHGAVDLHVDLPFQVHYRHAEGVTRTGMLRAGCVRTVALSLFVPHQMQQRDFEAFSAVLESAEHTVRARGWAPAGQAVAGQVAVIMAVEGAEPLADRLDAVPGLVARGVRLFGLVHTHHNRLATSSSDPHPSAGGLTARGRRFVEAVYAAGALVDVSHASDATFDDVAAIAARHRKPLVASHSNARAVTEHGRNLTDAQLRAIAASGGVVGVLFHAPFVRDDWREASVLDVADHVMHMRAVMGPGHVGVGSDLDGLIAPAKGLSSHAGYAALADALDGRGLDRGAIAGVLGGNAARVLMLP
jgi:membrane dipeptidase